MTTIDDAPLIEAIFELRWGNTSSGQFSFKRDEQSLLPGKLSASAAAKGYKFCQIIPHIPLGIPGIVSHRFKKDKDSWPCFQIGLGVFTVNQINDGYDWDEFKKSIKAGLEIFTKADPEKLSSEKNTLSAIMRYQDAFYPSAKMSTEEFLSDHLKVDAKLPDSFLDNPNLNRAKSGINLRFNLDTIKPKGVITIGITNAVINTTPGILMETIVESKLSDSIGNTVNTKTLLEWSEKAHDLQRHTFKNLIKTTAYQR